MFNSIEKRPVPDSDELPEIRGNYKRIKTMPRSPSPVRVLSVDFLKESSKSELFQKGIEFLRGCFPAKSVEVSIYSFYVYNIILAMFVLPSV